MLDKKEQINKTDSDVCADFDKKEQNNSKKFALKSAREITYVAIMSAMLVLGKFALSFIPNVEVVTTLVMVFACCFGYRVLGATVVFCTLDMVLYSFSIDVAISYYIYWNALAFVGATMRKFGAKSTYAYLILAIVGTVSFGFITTGVYCIMYGTPFLPMYVSGLVFYAVQLVGNIAFMLVGFAGLCKIIKMTEWKI
jgi:energy-coupling factor transport system substrate-specific component